MNFHRLILLALLLWLALPAAAHNRQRRQIDSLRALLAQAQQPQHVRHFGLWQQLARLYSLESRDSLGRIVPVMSRMAAQLNNERAWLDVYNAQAALFHQQLQYDSSNYYARRSLALSKELNATYNQAEANLFIALNENHRGRFKVALPYALHAVQQARELNQDRLLCAGLNLVAIIYGQDGNRAEVERYYKLAYEAARRAHNPGAQGAILSNLGNLYLVGDKPRPDSALLLFKRALALYNADGAVGRAGRAHANMAESYRALHQPDSARAAVQRCLAYARAHRDAEAFIYSLNSWADIELGERQYARALTLAREGADSAKRYGRARELYDLLAIMRKATAAMGNHAQAYALYEQEMSLHDSLYRPDLAKEKARLVEEFEAERRQLEIDQLEHEKAQQEEHLQRQRLYTLGALLAAIIFALLAGFTWRMYRGLQATREQLQGYINLTKEQNRQLADANRTKDKLFSIIAHDLRGPVAGFQLIPHMMDMAIAENDLSILQSTVKDLRESTRSLNRLLEGLLTWAQSQTGTLSYVPESSAVNLLFDEQTSLFAETARKKNITLHTQLEGPCFVQADRPSIETVLRNLVNNALKFTGQGGHIWLKARTEKGRVIITVTDTGTGIPAEKVPRIFVPGERFKATGTAGEKGNGLGLVLVSELVRHNHGQITVSSQLGQGTTFTIDLPAGQPVEALVEEAV